MNMVLDVIFAMLSMFSFRKFLENLAGGVSATALVPFGWPLLHQQQWPAVYCLCKQFCAPAVIFKYRVVRGWGFSLCCATSTARKVHIQHMSREVYQKRLEVLLWAEAMGLRFWSWLWFEHSWYFLQGGNNFSNLDLYMHNLQKCRICIVLRLRVLGRSTKSPDSSVKPFVLCVRISKY